jgi:hypothetical protein
MLEWGYTQREIEVVEDAEFDRASEAKSMADSNEDNDAQAD